jgi:hypothetical protein
MCAQVRARAELFRGLGRASSVTLTLRWHDSEEERTVTFEVDRTVQRLGGSRCWFLCPQCSGRRGLLISPGVEEPFACVRCWRGVYLSDYSSLHMWAILLGRVSPPLHDHHGDLARRRRGVHRPRGVKRRAARLVERMGLAKFLRRLAWEARDPATFRRSKSSMSCDDSSTSRFSRSSWNDSSGGDPRHRNRNRPVGKRAPYVSQDAQPTDPP